MVVHFVYEPFHYPFDFAYLRFEAGYGLLVGNGANRPATRVLAGEGGEGWCTVVYVHVK